MAKKITVNETSLRRVVLSILSEQDDATGTDSNQPAAPEALSTAGVSQTISPATQGIKEVLMSMLSRASTDMQKIAVVRAALGGNPKYGTSGALLIATTSDPYITTDGKRYESMDEYARESIDAFKDSAGNVDVDGLSEFIASIVSSELDLKFSDGILVNETINGKETGKQYKIDASVFFYLALVFSRPATSAAGSLSNVTFDSFSETLSQILVGTSAGGISIGESFVKSAQEIARGLEQKTINTVTGLKDTIDVVISSTNEQKSSIDASGVPQAPPAEQLQYVSISDSIVRSLQQIAEANRAAIDSSDPAARTYVSESAVIASAANDIAESISGTASGIRGVLPDVWQTQNDLKILANAILDSYNNGLLILDSEGSTFEGAVRMPDDLVHKKDKFMGLATAFWSASKIVKSRERGVLMLALANFGLALGTITYNYSVYKGALSGATSGPALFGWMRGIANLFYRVRKSPATKGMMERLSLLKNGLKRLKSAKADSQNEIMANTRLQKDLLSQIEVVEADLTNGFDAYWESLWHGAILNRQIIATSPERAEDIGRITAGIRDQTSDDILRTFDSLDPGEVSRFARTKDIAKFVAEYKDRFTSAGANADETVGFLTAIYSKIKESPAAVSYDDVDDIMVAIDSTPDIMRGTLSEFFDALTDVSRDPRVTAAVNELQSSKDMAAFAKTIRMTSIISTPIGYLMSSFFAYYFLRAVNRGMGAAGSSGTIVADILTGLNRIDEAGSIIAQDNAARKNVLTNNGELESSGDDLVNKISFKSSKFLADENTVSAIDTLASSCRDALISAKNVDPSGIEAKIQKIKTDLDAFVRLTGEKPKAAP